MFVRDLCYWGLRHAGVLGNAGRNFPDLSAVMTDVLAVMNHMVDEWTLHRCLVYAESRVLQTIKAGKQDYKIGLDPTADWQIPRPVRMERAGFIFSTYTPAIEYPFKVYTIQQWASVSPKDLTTNVPYILYYEPDTPLGTAHLWPVPTSSWQIALYPWVQISQFANIGDQIILPPGYFKAIVYNLAVELSTVFPERQRMSPIVPDLAAKAMQWVKNINAQVLLLQAEEAAMGTGRQHGFYRILSNSWNY